MKSLYLMRHGKSDWTDPDWTDKERPLKKRGRKAARCMGRFLEKAGQVPDLILASPAVRAAETARLLEAAFEAKVPGGVLPELYGEPAEWESLKRGFPQKAESVLLVGHNPFLEDLAAALVGAGPGGIRMATAAVVKISFDAADWTETKKGAGILEWSLTPRLLQGRRPGKSPAGL